MRTNVLRDESGAAALIVMVVLLAILVLVVTSVSFLGVDDLEIGSSEQISGDVVLSAESCVEEAMLRLSRDNSYAGGSLSVGEVDCTITVTGSPCSGSCTIEAVATEDGYTRTIEADVNVSGADVDITSWQET